MKTPAERAREVVTVDLVTEAIDYYVESAMAHGWPAERVEDVMRNADMQEALVAAFTRYFEQNDDAKDAARYRWLVRTRGTRMPVHIAMDFNDAPDDEACNRVIDAAMQENPDE